MDRRTFLKWSGIGLGIGLATPAFGTGDQDKNGFAEAFELPTVTDTRAVFTWTNSKGCGSVLHIVDGVGREKTFSFSEDTTFIYAEVKDLKPSTTYRYLLLDSKTNAVFRIGKFKTLPGFNEKPIFRFGLINDLHIGESHTGCFYWKSLNFPKCFASPNPDQPHWKFCVSRALHELKNSNIDFLIVNGDVSNRDSLQEYRAALELFRDFPVPVYLGRGNHDVPRKKSADTTNFLKGLELKDSKYRFNHKGMRFILGDFIDRHSPLGKATVTKATLDWFDETLEEDSLTPTFLFLHHPLLRTVTLSDWNRASDPKMLLERIRNRGNIQGIFTAHTHGAARRAFKTKAGLIPHLTTISPKEYPTCRVLFEVYKDGYIISTNRLSGQDTLAWNHYTRSMVFGLAPYQQFGTLADRNFTHRFIG